MTFIDKLNEIKKDSENSIPSLYSTLSCLLQKQQMEPIKVLEKLKKTGDVSTFLQENHCETTETFSSTLSLIKEMNSLFTTDTSPLTFVLNGRVSCKFNIFSNNFFIYISRYLESTNYLKKL
jgi:hypothetical protein